MRDHHGPTCPSLPTATLVTSARRPDRCRLKPAAGGWAKGCPGRVVDRANQIALESRNRLLTLPTSPALQSRLRPATGRRSVSRRHDRRMERGWRPAGQPRCLQGPAGGNRKARSHGVEPAYVQATSSTSWLVAAPTEALPFLAAAPWVVRGERSSPWGAIDRTRSRALAPLGAASTPAVRRRWPGWASS